MLVEFNVTNYRSVCETQTLNMSASKTGGLEDNCFVSGIRRIPNLLSSVAMYGPNAAGKSNFIKAISFMKNFVMTSSKDKQEGDSINVEPFKFNYDKRNSFSEFEVAFIKNAVLYQYGFSVTKTRVINEWLVAYPEGRPQRWFDRQYDSDNNSEDWYLGSKLFGNRKVWEKATRSNALFLSTAIQLNSDQLKPVFEWFQELKVMAQSDLLPSASTIEQCENGKLKQRIIDFMNAADLSISDIKLEKKKFSIEHLPDDMPEDVKEKIYEDLKDEKFVNIEFLHSSTNSSKLVPIDLEEESAGTRKFFAFAGPWLDFLEKGHVFFIDELNSSLHPLMVRFLVGLLHDPLINKNNAQLVFTTHDTSILDRDFFRRDQIWFFEKDKDNSTHLYPLTDFKLRGHEALEKDYLQGRYGALPFVGEFDF